MDSGRAATHLWCEKGKSKEDISSVKGVYPRECREKDVRITSVRLTGLEGKAKQKSKPLHRPQTKREKGKMKKGRTNAGHSP